MHCASCSALIRDISSEFPDIQNVSIDMNAKQIVIQHSEKFNFARWKQEVENMGEEYRVSLA